MADIESGGAVGAFGTGPYGDRTEVLGPPETTIFVAPYHPFQATDARSLMMVLHPQHYNFIPNPSFRVDDAGWEITPAASLDTEDSWVGQSVLVSQDTTLRYRDLDKDSGTAYVYVGPEQDTNEQEWYEPGRGSAQWTFSCYASGAGRVRLTMTAYAPEDASIALSPPRNANLPTNSDPSALPYDAGTPAYVDDDGQVWELRQAPYYERVGPVPATATDPSTITAAIALPPLVQDSSNVLWDVDITAIAAPYYTSQGAPATDPDPARADTGPEYLRSSVDGSLWRLKNPAPGVPPEDPESPGAIPEGWYYTPVTVPLVASPTTVEPDISKAPPWLLWTSDGSLWGFDGTNGYTLLGTPVAESSPTTAVPGSDYLLDDDNAVWSLISTPYYEATGTTAWLAQVVGDWEEVSPEGWERVMAQTSVRVLTALRAETEPDSYVTFQGCAWIDAVIEVEPDPGEEMRISSIMLDPTEYPVAQYFDGAMTEDPVLDDFLWSGAANDSVSYYYYDRLVRTRWLWEYLKYVVPVGRPYQIFFGTYQHPYIPPAST